MTRWRTTSFARITKRYADNRLCQSRVPANYTERLWQVVHAYRSEESLVQSAELILRYDIPLRVPIILAGGSSPKARMRVTYASLMYLERNRPKVIGQPERFTQQFLAIDE